MVRGLAAAETVLTRIDPLDLSSLPEEALRRTRDLFGDDATPESSIIQMLREVRSEGDVAVRRYARLLDGADLEPASKCLGPNSMLLGNRRQPT